MTFAGRAIAPTAPLSLAASFHCFLRPSKRTATARLAVFNKAANARALMNALPSGDASDTGLAFHREQLLRKAGKIDEAAKIILAIPPDPGKIAVLDEWWAERRELAYGALKMGKAKLAYELVKNAGPLTVNPLKEQTFMAGWIAFRYLKNADAAEKHFKDLEAAADGPLSRAKAAYWLGRVADVRGDKAAAAKQYRIASKNPDTFHGLLAMQMLDPGRKSLEIAPPAFPSAEQIDKLVSLDTAKALVLATKAKLSREYTRSLLAALRNGSPSEAEAGMVAHLADALGDPQMSVRIAKAAVAKGQNLLTYAYPLRPFPAYKPLRVPPETAFLLGIARQETEFEPQTVSGAGAKGLLQVMTVTANHVCHDYKIKCQIPRLLSDNAVQCDDRLGLHRRSNGRIRRLVRAGARRIQCRTRPGAPVDPRKWRPARSEGRSDRLDRTHPDYRNARIRDKGAGEYSNVSCAPWRHRTRASHAAGSRSCARQFEGSRRQ